jgi:hypothetical protein
MRKKRFLGIALSLVVAAGLAPNITHAYYQTNCTYWGESLGSCVGVELKRGDTYGYSKVNYFRAGQTLNVKALNVASSGHTVAFRISGPNGWNSPWHTAAPDGRFRTWHSDRAPVSGYYKIYSTCSYKKASDCNAETVLYRK